MRLLVEIIELISSEVPMTSPSPIHWHSSEKRLKNIIKLLELEVLTLCSSSSVLRARVIFFGSKLIIVSAFVSINEVCICIGDFFENFFCTLVGVFIGVEAEGEGTVGFFDLSISGCLLDP